jgi:hypothetical protein
MVGHTKHVKKALEAGVDIICAQGIFYYLSKKGGEGILSLKFIRWYNLYIKL